MSPVSGFTQPKDRTLKLKKKSKTDGLVKSSLIWVASLSFGYFIFEFFFAMTIKSVALLADSLDFLEDGFITLLVFLSLHWSVKTRSRIGRFFSLLVLMPSIWTCIQVLEKIQNPKVPEVFTMIFISLGAAVMNIISAFIFLRIKDVGGALIKDAWVVTRNDVTINFSIIFMGLITHFLIQNGWPDIVLGILIFLLNVNAAWTIWKTAHLEEIPHSKVLA
jgi:Co/Zn/Cd efflux system component